MSTQTNPERASAAPAAAPAAEPAVRDVAQLALIPAILSLGWVVWCVGGMEMIERLAYYGVRMISGLYATEAKSKGGLGITTAEVGTIFLWWGLVQAILPALTGGLSDRYGYKQTIFVSTVLKLVGYLLMGFLPVKWGFFLGAIVVATGTAVFKPGIQGTLVNATNRQNSSVAWGIFYQTVNIGGFIGPLIATFMQRMEWKYVFLACAAAIALNFFMLLTYKEPKMPEAAMASRGAKTSLWRESLKELGKPHVWRYLLVFSGFWFLFYGLQDILPLHTRDWLDTRPMVTALFGADGAQSGFAKFFFAMNDAGTEISPNGIFNVNGAIIMTTCFLFAALSAKMRATTSMVVGTAMATLAMFFIGSAAAIWLVVMAISIFSVGEMLSSPKFSEFAGNMAPADKKAMYLGFTQIPVVAGTSIQGKVGMMIYGRWGEKERFARAALEQHGLTHAQAAAVPNGEAFTKLVSVTGQEPWALTHELYKTNNPAVVWYIYGAIGVATAIAIFWYGHWAKNYSARQAEKAA